MWRICVELFFLQIKKSQLPESQDFSHQQDYYTVLKVDGPTPGVAIHLLSKCYTSFWLMLEPPTLPAKCGPLPIAQARSEWQGIYRIEDLRPFTTSVKNLGNSGLVVFGVDDWG